MRVNGYYEPGLPPLHQITLLAQSHRSFSRDFQIQNVKLPDDMRESADFSENASLAPSKPKLPAEGVT